MNPCSPSGPRFRPTLTALEARDTPASSGYVASGAIAGGLPLVEVDRPDGTILARFQAFDTGFTGGVRAAVGNLDGNPNAIDVVAAAGPGGGPRVEVFSVSITTGQVAKIADFFVFESSFRNGLRVAVGQVAGGTGSTGVLNLGSGIGNGTTTPEQIIVGADAGGGPRVRVLQLQNGTGVQIPGPLGDFFAFEPGFRGGVRVAAGDVDGNPANGDEIVVGAGPGGGPRVRVFRSDGMVIRDSFALPAGTTSGVNVAVNPVSNQIVTDGLPADFSQRNGALNAAALANSAAARPAFAAPGTSALFGTTAGGFGTIAGSNLSGTTTGGIGTTSTTGGVFGTIGVTFGATGTTTAGFGTTTGVSLGSTTGLGSTGTGTLGSTTTGLGSTGTGTVGTTTAGMFGTTGAETFGTTTF